MSLFSNRAPHGQAHHGRGLRASSLVDESRYEELGTRIKCNPAIKNGRGSRGAAGGAQRRAHRHHRDRSRAAYAEREEAKLLQGAGRSAARAARGAECCSTSRRTARSPTSCIVDKACHAPADMFGVVERGYVREGWFRRPRYGRSGAAAHGRQVVTLLAKCHWSPFEGHTFSSTIDTTIVNGEIVYRDGELTKNIAGQRWNFPERRNFAAGVESGRARKRWRFPKLFTFRAIPLC